MHAPNLSNTLVRGAPEKDVYVVDFCLVNSATYSSGVAEEDRTKAKVTK